jgi:quinoprotein glucose dehydrogenase
MALGSLSTAATVGRCSAQDWPVYGGDPGGRRASSADQITSGNVARLEHAWTFRTGATGEGARDLAKTTFEATPILFDGKLVLPTAWGTVIAIDPGSGGEVWRHDAGVPRDRGYSEVTSRGVAGWTDHAVAPGDRCARRIFYATIDARLIALDSATGERCSGFGSDGVVDLGPGAEALPESGDYQVTSPPAIAGDLVVVGSSIGDNWAADTGSGVVRAYDARNGAERWRFDPLAPSRAAARRVGAANAWGPISVDIERGRVIVPVGSPSPDFYGGLRPGDGRWGSSVVALDAATGEVAWGFQTVHHDLWDYDLAAQPTLAAIERGGARRDVVVQATKMGFVYVLDAATGEPLFPVEERRVPPSDVEGEQAAATQPFPTRPAPLRLLDGLDLELSWVPEGPERDACRRLLEGARFDGIFSPPSLGGTVLFPGNGGGTRWGGVAVDQERGLLVLNSMWVGTLVQLIPRAELASLVESSREAGYEVGAQMGAPFAMRRTELVSPRGIPCTPPPWGTLTAIDLATGERVWEVALGELPDGHPLADHPDAASFGVPNGGGPMVTAGGLVFIGATRERLLRALDLETGAELWRGELPYAAISTPMTYVHGGRQLVVIAAGGHGKGGLEIGDAVVAFALPSSMQR